MCHFGVCLKSSSFKILHPIRISLPFFKSFIRAHLDYCDIIFHEPAKSDVMGQSLSTLMQEVERIQYQAGLVVSGAWKGTSRMKIYEELGWESLSDRRRIRRVLLLQ